MYKYCIYGPGGRMQEHCDPYGFEMELRPGACSIINDIGKYEFHDKKWMVNRSSGKRGAVNIYEMHLGSWRQNPEDENGWYEYDEIAEMLVPYIKENNYILLMDPGGIRTPVFSHRQSAMASRNS